MLFIKPSLRSVKLETKTKIDEKCKKKLYKKVTEPKQKNVWVLKLIIKIKKESKKAAIQKAKVYWGIIRYKKVKW